MGVWDPLLTVNFTAVPVTVNASDAIGLGGYIRVHLNRAVPPMPTLHCVGSLAPEGSGPERWTLKVASSRL